MYSYKEYYTKNRERLLLKGREYYLNNKTKCNAATKRWSENHKDHVRECARKWHTEHKERSRNNYLKRRFGISLEEYNKLFEKQQGYCAICKTHQKDLKKALSVDHDHRTGKVKGLLCSTCNYNLGWYEKLQENILSYNRSINNDSKIHVDSF